MAEALFRAQLLLLSAAIACAEPTAEPATAAPSVPESESEMSFGVKFVIFTLTYLCAIGIGIFGIKKFREMRAEQEEQPGGIRRWFGIGNSSTVAQGP